MKKDWQKIVQLLTSASPESKIAGIAATNQILERCSNPDLIDELIGRVLDLVSVTVLLRMINTEHVGSAGDETPNNELSIVQRIGLDFFANAVTRSSSAIAKISDHSETIVSSYFNLRTESACEQLLLLLGLMSNSFGMESKIFRRRLVTSMLISSSKSKRVSSLKALTGLVEVLASTSLTGTAVNVEQKPPPLLELSDKEASILQDLFIQGLHGAAPESTRDTLFTYLSMLLPHSNCCCVSPAWTTIASSRSHSSTSRSTEPHDESSYATGMDAYDPDTRDDQKGTVGNFSLFIVSVLRAELHLLLEEMLFLASHSETAMLQSQLADTVFAERLDKFSHNLANPEKSGHLNTGSTEFAADTHPSSSSSSSSHSHSRQSC